MNYFLVLGCCVFSSLTAVTHGWGHVNQYGLSQGLSRRDACVKSGGQCFASEQCCRHFVCAAFDDLFGENPEVPGFCVREKDLHPCLRRRDCAPGSHCLLLGRGDIQKYCVILPQDEGGVATPQKPLGTSPLAATPLSSTIDDAAEHGRLGDKCRTSADCAPTTLDGSSQLCCQLVKRYRQKPHQICDRVSPLTACIDA